MLRGGPLIPKNFSNPVYDGCFADPFVWEHEGVFYAVGTGDLEGAGRITQAETLIPLLRSVDLQNWDYVGKALVPPPETLGGSYWAPEVAYEGGKFYLYYAAGKGGHRMRVAVADKPTGPYHDVGQPMVDQAKIPFSIDGTAFKDDDGKWYFYYAADFLDLSAQGRVGTTIVVDRLINMTELAGDPQPIVRAMYDWQLYERNFKKHGGTWEWYTIEGPHVRKRLGKYWCMYSGGCYQNDSYGVDFLVADHPLGPWRDTGSAHGGRLLHSQEGVIGPGHHSIVTDPKTGQDYIVYHAWDKAMTMRQMWIDPLNWTSEGPRVERFSQGGGA
jgi:GH43 family beta-xylosidase